MFGPKFSSSSLMNGNSSEANHKLLREDGAIHKFTFLYSLIPFGTITLISWDISMPQANKCRWNRILIEIHSSIILLDLTRFLFDSQTCRATSDWKEYLRNNLELQRWLFVDAENGEVDRDNFEAGNLKVKKFIEEMNCSHDWSYEEMQRWVNFP